MRFGQVIWIPLYVTPGIVYMPLSFNDVLAEVQNWPEFHLIWHLEYTSKSINIGNIENFGRVESSEGICK